MPAPLTKTALEALALVRDKIDAEPACLDMHTFLEVRDGRVVACIAGHLALQRAPLGELLEADPADILRRGADALDGLAVSAASFLFHSSAWPANYRLGLERGTSSSAKAQVTVDLLWEIAKTGELWWAPSARP